MVKDHQARLGKDQGNINPVTPALPENDKLCRHRRRNRGTTIVWHVVAAVIAWHLRPIWKRYDQRIDVSDKGALVDVVHQLLERLNYRDAKENPISKEAIGKYLRRSGWQSEREIKRAN